MTALFMFPDLSQRTFRAIDRIVIGDWQTGDTVIGFGSLARSTSKQVPLASTRVSANNSKILARADFLVRYTGWNYDHVPGMHLDVPAVLAAESQCRKTTINSKRFMRGAVIMSKGINTVSPRVGPIVLSKALFNNRRAIFRLRCECLPINQQRQVAVRESAVVLEPELLRLNEFFLFNHAEAVRNDTAISRERNRVVVFRQTFIQKQLTIAFANIVRMANA